MPFHSLAAAGIRFLLHRMNCVVQRLRPLGLVLSIVLAVVVSAQQDLPTTTANTTNDISQTEDEDIDPGFCIIRPDEPASIEIFADYNSRRFYFCCETCRKDFLSDPSRFESLSLEREDEAPLEHYAPGNSDAFDQSFWGRIGAAYLAVQNGATYVSVKWQLQDPVNAVLVFLSFASVAGWLVRWRLHKKRKVDQSQSQGNRWAVPLLTIGLLVCGFYAAAYRRRWIQFEEKYHVAESERVNFKTRFTEVTDRDSVHYATFMNYGFPPRPLPSTQPASLAKTYYRGNDERGDEMFNGGNYRTVTFEIAMLDAQGNELTAGDSVLDTEGHPRPAFLMVKFVRSPDTSSGYFTADYMKRMYLTQQADEFLGVDEPVSDRIDWEMTEKNQVWEAQFALDLSEKLPAEVEESDCDASGIVYLCEERFEASRLLGGRYHYAVQYRLNTDQGTLLNTSDLWMGAMYHGRNFGDLQIQPKEWLSNEPLPEKP